MISFKAWWWVPLAVFAAGALVSHAQTGDSIRILAVPVEARHPTQQVADMPLHVPYPGKIDRNRKLFVRVFRGSPEEQVKKLPHDLRVGDCVLYTSSVRFAAYSDGDGALRIDEIVDFFNTNVGQATQVLTLVFEEGEDASSGGPLKLSRDGVNLYFANAMKLPLLVSERERRVWDEQIAQWKRQERETQSARNGNGGLFGWLRPAPVQAAERPTSPPPLSSQVNPSPVVTGPCDRVSVVPFVHAATNPDVAKTEISPLSAVAQLVVRGCGL